MFGLDIKSLIVGIILAMFVVGPLLGRVTGRRTQAA